MPSSSLVEVQVQVGVEVAVEVQVGWLEIWRVKLISTQVVGRS